MLPTFIPGTLPSVMCNSFEPLRLPKLRICAYIVSWQRLAHFHEGRVIDRSQDNVHEATTLIFAQHQNRWHHGSCPCSVESSSLLDTDRGCISGGSEQCQRHLHWLDTASRGDCLFANCHRSCSGSGATPDSVAD